MTASKGSSTQASGLPRDAAAKLTLGVVYEGVITEIDNTRSPFATLYTVTTKDPSVVVPGCANGLGFFSGTIGYNMDVRFLKGTKVLIVVTSQPWIVGCPHYASRVAYDNYDNTPALFDGPHESFRPEIVFSESANGTTIRLLTDGAPSDLLGGELNMSNLMGVGVQFLTSMLRLQAGEGSKIEMSLRQGLLRMFSEIFRHHSAIGDSEIYHDGGTTNYEFHGSPWEFEVNGRQQQTDPRLETDDGGYKVQQDEMDTPVPMRDRISAYVGHVGDLISLFVHDPAKVIEDIATPPTGKFRANVNSDGGLLVQSAADIAFERVVAIPVPQRVKDYDDAEGNLSVSMLSLEKKFLQLPAIVKDGSPMGLAFTLREYARWLSEVHSLQRFHQLNKDFAVTRQGGANYDNGEPDKISNATIPAPVVYSTIRIMRDGSQVLHESDGATVVLARGKIWLSAPNGFHIDSGGDVEIKAGGNFRVFACRDIEIVSWKGSLITKARTAWRALCEWGAVHLRSDMDPNDLKSKLDQPDPENDPDPAAQRAQNEPPVLIEASLGRSAVVGTDLSLAATAGRLEIQQKSPSDSPEHGIFATSTRVKLSAQAKTAENGGISVRTNGKMSISGSDILFRVAKFFSINRSVVFEIGRGFFVNSRTFVNRLIARGRISGPPSGPQPLPGVDTTSAEPHGNHISVISDQDSAEPAPNVPEIDVSPAPALGFRPESARWKLRAADHSIWSTADGPAPPQTLAQRVAEDREAANPGSYGSFSVSDTGLLGARIEGDRVPMWGSIRQMMRMESQLPAMDQPLEFEPAETVDKITGKLQPAPAVFFYRKPPAT